jgi:hypothetical protein
LSPSVLTGVGHAREDEEPLPEVGRPDLGRGEHAPFRIEPERGQVSEDNVESSNSESRHVLHEDEARSHVANDTSEVTPEAGVLALDAGSLARVADVGAREAASDEIHDATPRAAVEGS